MNDDRDHWAHARIVLLCLLFAGLLLLAAVAFGADPADESHRSLACFPWERLWK